MKIGDRVIVNGEWDGLELKDSKGTVTHMEDGYRVIEFDEFINGNTIGGGKPGHSWCFPTCMIKKEDTMKDRIAELEKELAELKDQLNKKYEPMTGDYAIMGDGIIVYKDHHHENYKKTGRLFDTKEKAEKARDIMVKHDIVLKYVIDHDPDFVPDNYNSFSIYFDQKENKWYTVCLDVEAEIGTILMPDWVAEKLADDLNNGRLEL